jgi:hypothetical protein|tara:strand:- start:630 stop:1040 length:411 start_codon:yes stop_codon:yes gene_type:complete
MLSPPDGQTIAANAGILPSSEDVFEEEERDILRSWSYLTSAGIVESLSDAADWMSDIMVADDMLPDGVDDDEMIGVGFDMDNPDSDDFMALNHIPLGELRKMHRHIKDSTYNTVLGCLVASISKLLDEDLITLENL